MDGSQPVLAVRNISKAFSGRLVLDQFAMTIQPGEVHALLGQNGSGKSTFIKILAGYQAPEEGARMWASGVELKLPIRRPELDRLGFSFVHQDLGLLPGTSVLENMLVGRYDRRLAWRIPWRAERQRVIGILEQFGLDLDPESSVDSLTEVDRALLAIVRAVEQVSACDQGLLVLDEPTAYLPRDGIERLFALVRQVAAAGLGVLFVTHRLEEVFSICDHATVLRDGKVIANRDVAALTEAALIEDIIGFPIEQLYPDPVNESDHAPLLEAEVAGGRLRDTSVTLGRGEIVGVTGLVGMGWEELPYLLFGAGSGHGRVTIDGCHFHLGRFRVNAAVRAGLALLPANRARDGAAGALTVRDNLTVTTLGEYFSFGLLRKRREVRASRAALEIFEVQPTEPLRSMATLSGGNQQKVLIAKWLATHPKVFLMHEPTQGVDVGAKRQVFAAIRAAADAGGGVLVASAEYEDLAHICDRVIVFRDGRAVRELSGIALTKAAVLQHSFSAQDPESSAQETLMKGRQHDVAQ